MSLNEKDATLLARIDERTKILVQDMDRIYKTLDQRFVTIEELRPIRNIAYGMVSVILVSVVGSILALVLK